MSREFTGDRILPLLSVAIASSIEALLDVFSRSVQWLASRAPFSLANDSPRARIGEVEILLPRVFCGKAGQAGCVAPYGFTARFPTHANWQIRQAKRI